jgi:hypothetical protein
MISVRGEPVEPLCPSTNISLSQIASLKGMFLLYTLRFREALPHIWLTNRLFLFQEAKDFSVRPEFIEACHELVEWGEWKNPSRFSQAVHPSTSSGRQAQDDKLRTNDLRKSTVI